MFRTKAQEATGGEIQYENDFEELKKTYFSSDLDLELSKRKSSKY